MVNTAFFSKKKKTQQNLLKPGTNDIIQMVGHTISKSKSEFNSQYPMVWPLALPLPISLGVAPILKKLWAKEIAPWERHCGCTCG